MCLLVMSRREEPNLVVKTVSAAFQEAKVKTLFISKPDEVCASCRGRGNGRPGPAQGVVGDPNLPSLFRPVFEARGVCSLPTKSRRRRCVSSKPISARLRVGGLGALPDVRRSVPPRRLTFLLCCVLAADGVDQSIRRQPGKQSQHGAATAVPDDWCAAAGGCVYVQRHVQLSRPLFRKTCCLSHSRALLSP